MGLAKIGETNGGDPRTRAVALRELLERILNRNIADQPVVWRHLRLAGEARAQIEVGRDRDIGRDGMGGVKSIYLANYENVSGVTSADGVITAIAKANGGRFYKFNLTRATASAIEEILCSQDLSFQYIN